MKTLALNDLQAAFHEHLLNGAPTIAQEVVSGGCIGVDHRLHIYHNAYRVRLQENLRDAFEKTWAYLGDETFAASTLAYLEENPPRHRNLRWHGANFPQWLAKRFPQDLDIAELATIDWQLRHAFDGPNGNPLAPAELAGLAAEQWETVGFQFVPTLFLAPLQYNTVDIWHALDQEQTPPAVEALPEPTWLLIWRKGWQPHFRTIHAIEQAALSQLHAGASFARVCAALSEHYSDQLTTQVIGASLRTWLQDELIVGLNGMSHGRAPITRVPA
jgi:hypothetical protein